MRWLRPAAAENNKRLVCESSARLEIWNPAQKYVLKVLFALNTALYHRILLWCLRIPIVLRFRIIHRRPNHHYPRAIIEIQLFLWITARSLFATDYAIRILLLRKLPRCALSFGDIPFPAKYSKNGIRRRDRARRRERATFFETIYSCCSARYIKARCFMYTLLYNIILSLPKLKKTILLLLIYTVYTCTLYTIYITPNFSGEFNNSPAW